MLGVNLEYWYFKKWRNSKLMVDSPSYDRSEDADVGLLLLAEVGITSRLRSRRPAKRQNY